MMIKKPAIFAGMVLLPALLLGLNTHPANTSFMQRSAQQEKPALTYKAATTTAWTRHNKEKNIAASSLSGSQVDAADVFLENGTIMIDHSLRFYYEYFLSLQREISEGEISLLLVRDANKRYPSAAAIYVIELFQRYKNYLQKSNGIILKTQQDIALSAEEQQGIAITLQDTLFNDVERSALFNNDFLDQHGDVHNTQGAYEHFKKMQRQLPLADIDVLRVENFGVEVASRFTALDEKRALWQQRLNDYQCEKQSIYESEGLHAMDKKQSIEDLQQRLFSLAEIRRVQSLKTHKMLKTTSVCS